MKNPKTNPGNINPTGGDDKSYRSDPGNQTGNSVQPETGTDEDIIVKHTESGLNDEDHLDETVKNETDIF